ncbi:unnamed protein product [[Candida] boidinii]|nr:unnamed protein product [[Candida] boidinii]GMF61417.1 unnamed protein product [[Candida] boidinii]
MFLHILVAAGAAGAAGFLLLALLKLLEVVVLAFLANEEKVAKSSEQRNLIVSGRMSDPLQTESRVL